ncbi:MAG: DNA polymerase III subunit gamma/tau, partial [Bacteriovorax sp.]|nr:DNA polymerase III subunit gamma/tau [Bacteriovorax sp.]
MSYQVLARKWRPKKFQEVIGQGHVTRALQNAILNKKIGHAYMLVGTRGVGKTSVARIFAKAIRCENLTADGNACCECRACLDFDTETSMNVIEIDGASNNSVDNIRELIGNVHYLPTSGKYKVYIIDEVHMLSTNAFNALLKTLEEPPAHVVFIFATTEAQKLLGTVLSRCQRFDFRNVSVPDLVARVKEIAKVEGIKFENEQLINQLAILGRGSVRDTLSLLDQVLTTSLNDNISEENLTNSLGVAGPSSLQNILKSLYAGDTSGLSLVYNKLLEENVPVKNIASGLLDELFKELKSNKDIGEAEMIWIYETIARETSWIFSSIAPEKSFEVLLYKTALRRSFFSMKMPASEPSAQSIEAVPVVVVETVKENIPKTVAETFAQNFAELAKEAEIEKDEVIVQSKTFVLTDEELQVLPAESIAKKQMSWEGFLNFLNIKAPASASNLEQGNITSPLRLENGELSVELGFGYSGLVFLDYLSEPEVFQKLINNLSEYFEVDKNKINLQLLNVQTTE